jgi:hypothetical protein
MARTLVWLEARLEAWVATLGDEFQTCLVPIATIEGHVLVNGDRLQETMRFDVGFELGEPSIIHHWKRKAAAAAPRRYPIALFPPRQAD